MLIRTVDVNEQTCLCLARDEEEEKRDEKKTPKKKKLGWVQCSKRGCTSPWWHRECAGLTSLSDLEVKKMKFTCALRQLSDAKFRGNFDIMSAQKEEMKNMLTGLEKAQMEVNEVKKAMNDQLKELKEMTKTRKDSSDDEEKKRSEFFHKVSDQLKELKNELKESGEEEKKSYKKALMENISELKVKQNSVVTEVAKQVVSETRQSSYDRAKREKNVIIFGMEEKNDEEDKKIVGELFDCLGLNQNEVKFTRMGKNIVEEKIRPIKMIFQEVHEKKVFLSLLHKLKNGSETLKSLKIQHDLSPSERNDLNTLLKKAKQQNEEEKPKDFLYKVRGPPVAFKIVKIMNKQAKK